MKFKQVQTPARDSYRIDWPNKGYKFFYSEVWDSEAGARAHINRMKPKYKDQLEIVKFHEPAHSSLQGTMKL